MRVPLVLAAFALVLAGCTGGEDAPPASTTPAATATPVATPAATPTTEPTPPTPTPPTNATPTPTPTPTPTVTPTLPAPEVNITLRHDYGNASENLTFAIPPGASNLTVSVQFDAAPTALPGQYACAGALRIKIIRPDGSIHADVTASPGTASSPGTHCGAVSAGGTFPMDVPAGSWHADFSGAGTGIGWVRVQKSA